MDDWKTEWVVVRLLKSCKAKIVYRIQGYLFSRPLPARCIEDCILKIIPLADIDKRIQGVAYEETKVKTLNPVQKNRIIEKQIVLNQRKLKRDYLLFMFDNKLTNR